MKDKESGSLRNSFLILLLMLGLASLLPRVSSSARTADVGLSVRTNWPQLRYDNARSGVNPQETKLSPSNVSCLKRKRTVAVP
jgi:hypothetical protein